MQQTTSCTIGRVVLHTIFIHFILLFVLITSTTFMSSAWSACNANSPATTPSSDFTVHNDGTVTHLTTGLMWKVCSEGQTWLNGDCSGSGSTYTWDSALQIPQSVNAGGGYPLSGANYTDWRLPNIKELQSIVELKCYSPAVNEEIFPATPSGTPWNRYWSSSPDNSSNIVWVVRFDNSSDGNDHRISDNRVRLVRSTEGLLILDESDVDIKKGLVAHYEFENNAYDSSGNGHNGIENGSIVYVTGARGRAIKFDGNYQNYIRVPHNMELNIRGDYTFSYWINRGHDSGTQYPFSKGRDCLNSYFSSAGGRSFSIGNGSYGSSWCERSRVSMEFPVNEWHFITSIVNNSKGMLQYYLDGKLEKEISISRYATTNTYDLVLGRHDTFNNGSSSWAYPYIGSLDDMRIYSRALSDIEILTLYELGVK